MPLSSRASSENGEPFRGRPCGLRPRSVAIPVQPCDPSSRASNSPPRTDIFAFLRSRRTQLTASSRSSSSCCCSCCSSSSSSPPTLSPLNRLVIALASLGPSVRRLQIVHLPRPRAPCLERAVGLSRLGLLARSPSSGCRHVVRARDSRTGPGEGEGPEEGAVGPPDGEFGGRAHPRVRGIHDQAGRVSRKARVTVPLPPFRAMYL